jgi:hypothetical protein
MNSYTRIDELTEALNGQNRMCSAGSAFSGPVSSTKLSFSSAQCGTANVRVLLMISLPI